VVWGKEEGGTGSAHEPSSTVHSSFPAVVPIPFHLSEGYHPNNGG
jgi:hypothetical protein